MARQSSFSKEALEKLGAARLAELVWDGAERDAAFRKIVKAALAGVKGPDAVAALIDRRLAALAKARGMVEWEKTRAFAADLAATVDTISRELGRAAPALACDRLVTFLETSDAVVGRCDDSNGVVQAVYDNAAEATAALAAQIGKAEQLALASRVCGLIGRDGWSYFKGLATSLVPLLDAGQLQELDGELAANPDAKSKEPGFSRHSRVQVRQAIADARHDADAYIALAKQLPDRQLDPLEIASRLLAAGRAQEALDWMKQPARKGIGYMTAAGMADGGAIQMSGDRPRAVLEAEILDALGRRDEAQAVRWTYFAASLDGDMLKAYVAKAPEFEDVEALDRAFAHALASPHRYGALQFLLEWPRLDLAARHVLAHADAWDGARYHTLAPVAEMLEPDHPLAAGILYRALLGVILAKARSAAYNHAAAYWHRLNRLDAEIKAEQWTGAGHLVHSHYVATIKAAHGRKAAFWAGVEAGKGKKG